jgi:amidohydrolase family protein
MKTAVLWLWVMPFLTFGASGQVRTDRTLLVINHVTVIDATGSPPKPEVTVVIAGGRIDRMERSGSFSIPSNAHVVDARRRFLIPGLWDLHFHHWSENAVLFPLLIANGVTGVRDMGSGAPMEDIAQWRQEAESGTALAPHVISAERMIDGPRPLFGTDMSIAVSTPAEARQAVDYLKSKGADFIKVQSLVPRLAYFAIAEEARTQHLPLAGHVPASVSASEASDAGQRSIEHLTGILLGCSNDEENLTATIVRLVENPKTPESSLFQVLFFDPPHEILETYSSQKAKALFARFARNGTWQVPTLCMLRGWAFSDDPTLQHDWRLKYLPRDVQKDWSNAPSQVGAAALPNTKLLFRSYLRLIRDMRDAGVKFLAGTDTPNPYCFTGFAVHDELELLVKAGLTPMEALQAATRNPAAYLGKLDSLGTVERGKTADLVLLDANPLEDIRNTRRIAAVVIRGRLLAREDLDQMLARVESQVGAK